MAAKTYTEKEIGYTSTKADIWKAYKEAIEKLNKQDAQPQIKQTAIHKIGKSNNKLKNLFNEINTQIITQMDTSFSTLLAQFNQAEEVLRQIQQTAQKQKEELLEEKEQILKERRREQEEYDYEFKKRKQRQEEELMEKRKKVETELARQKEELKEQQDELVNLRKQVAAFDTRLANEIQKAKDKTTYKLKLTYDHEKALREQKFAGEIALQQQKIASLEEIVANQEKEIKRLQTTLSEASSQLTSIAEKAVTQKQIAQLSSSTDREKSFSRRISSDE